MEKKDANAHQLIAFYLITVEPEKQLYYVKQSNDMQLLFLYETATQIPDYPSMDIIVQELALRKIPLPVVVKG